MKPEKTVTYIDVSQELKRTGHDLAWLAHQSKLQLRTLRRHQERRAKSFRWTTLDKLCQALDCQPGRILKRTRRQPERRRAAEIQQPRETTGDEKR